MEQQRSARGAERQVSQLIEDHEVELGQAFGDLPGLGLFLFEGVDQLDGGEEAYLGVLPSVRELWLLSPQTDTARSTHHDGPETGSGA